jgi:hypothetical protein
MPGCYRIEQAWAGGIPLPRAIELTEEPEGETGVLEGRAVHAGEDEAVRFRWLPFGTDSVFMARESGSGLPGFAFRLQSADGEFQGTGYAWKSEADHGYLRGPVVLKPVDCDSS